MCKIALVFGLAMFIIQVHDLEAAPQGFDPHNYCQCQSTLVWDEAAQQHIGDCLTPYNGRHWCYAEYGVCGDQVESSERPGLYYSFDACQTQNLQQVPCLGEEVNCFVDPCQFAECPAHPNAICKSNYCGGCNAVFHDGADVVDDCYTIY